MASGMEALNNIDSGVWRLSVETGGRFSGEIWCRVRIAAAKVYTPDVGDGN